MLVNLIQLFRNLLFFLCKCCLMAGIIQKVITFGCYSRSIITSEVDAIALHLIMHECSNIIAIKSFSKSSHLVFNQRIHWILENPGGGDHVTRVRLTPWPFLGLTIDN